MTKVKTRNNADGFPDFNAGRFLREELAYSGHDTAWLAEQTGMSVAELERLFAMRNMDALLFVRTGHPLGDHFLQRIHRMIFDRTDEAN